MNISNNMMTPNKFFENVTNFKDLGETVTNKNCIYEKIRED